MNVGLPSETIKNAAICIKELERENAALREDKERLDWLERQANVSFGRCIASPEDHDAPAFALTVGLLNRKRSFPAATFRAAIDAAKKESGDDAIMRQHLTEGGTPT